MQKHDHREDLGRFEALCRSKGLSLTIQRRAVFQAVVERDDHPTADQIFEAVNERIPGISRTTVYRVLDTLLDLGVIRRVQCTGIPIRFDGSTHRHDHVICQRCGRVADVEIAGLDALPLPEGKPAGFQIHEYSVQFTGTCAECQEPQEEKEE